MSFFGMGSMEIVVIMILALIIFGPGKLPEIAGQAGKMVRDFRRVTRDLTSDFQESIDDVQSTMTEMRSTVDDMKRETEQLASSIPTTIDEGVRKPLGDATSGERHPLESSNTQADIPIAESPAPVATKDDPFADLLDLEEDVDDSGRPASVR